MKLRISHNAKKQLRQKSLAATGTELGTNIQYDTDTVIPVQILKTYRALISTKTSPTEYNIWIPAK